MTSRRLPTILLLAYVVFLLYGSFFPFEFTYDATRIERALDHPLRVYDADGRRLVSLPDTIANILLGIPFGVLMVWSGLGGASLAVRLGRVIVLDAALASAVEIGQLFTADRTSSVLDVATQTVGSLIGLLAMHALLAGSRRPLVARLRATPPAEVLVVLLVLAVVLTADALYPYAVTLDVSTVWHNVKAAQWRPLASLTRTFWPDLLVEKLLAYAMLVSLARTVLERLELRPPGPLAWTGAIAFAVGLEGAKLLIVGRAPNVDIVGLAALGGLVGVAVLPRLGRVPTVQTHAPTLLIIAAVALLVYEELTPFTFVDSVSALRARVPDIEWMPFGAYYGAEPQAALFDLGKKLLLGGGVGAAMRWGSGRPRLVLVALLAALLEAAQLCQPMHTASTTDIITIYGGAILGAFLVSQSRTLSADRRVPVAPPS